MSYDIQIAQCSRSAGGSRLKLPSLAQTMALRKEPRRVCTRCGGTRFERMPRFTFVQRYVMPFFNLYPWRCVICGQEIPRTLRANSEDRGDWG